MTNKHQIEELIRKWLNNEYDRGEHIDMYYLDKGELKSVMMEGSFDLFSLANTLYSQGLADGAAKERERLLKKAKLLGPNDYTRIFNLTDEVNLTQPEDA